MPAVGLGFLGLSPEVDMLGPLPYLAAEEDEERGDENDTPLPGDRRVFEDDRVDDGDVQKRENSDEAGDNGPEEELVAPDVEESLGKVLPGLGLHTEKGPAHVQHFSGKEKGKPGQGGEGRGAGAEDGVASVAIGVVAVFAEVAIAKLEHDKHESAQTERSSP